MLKRGIPAQRVFATLGALALSVPLAALGSAPASAIECDGSRDESGFVVPCSDGGGGGGGPIDTNWQFLAKWPDSSCNGPGNNGIRASAVRPGTTGPVSQFCIRTGTGGASITNEARAAAPPPTLKTDFKRAFLTGAKVTFDVGQSGNGSSYEDKWVRVDGFDNVWLHLQPERFRLDFGDGSPVSEWDADDSNAKSKYEHIYSKTSKEKPEVTITLTVWWSGFVHGNLEAPDPDAPPIQSLGEIDRTSTLQRPVVEVWSALTEPNN